MFFTRFNPYLKMKFNPFTNTIKMKPDDFIMWAKTFRELDKAQFSEVMLVFNMFSDKHIKF